MAGESEIEGNCISTASTWGWLHIKIARSHIRGFPDDLFMRSGIGIFVEFKDEGKPATKQQKLRHREIRDAGFEVFTIDNEEDFNDIFCHPAL